MKNDRPLRIGIVTNTSWNIVNFRMGLIHSLKQAGHEVFIIAPQDEHTATLIKKGFHPVLVKGLSRKGTNPFKDLLLIAELAKIYKSLKLDVALQYTIKPNIYGSIAGKCVGVKTVCTVTGLGYVFLNKGISSSIARGLYRFSFNLTNKIFFQNEDDRNLFLEKKLVSAKNSEVIPGSGIDIDYFHPDYCKTLHLKANSSDFCFVMIGRLLKDKGVYEYATAAAAIRKLYPNTRFIILGDQDPGNPAAVPAADIEKWSQEGIVELLGFIDDTRPYICEANAVVLPSYREGIPRVILEGLSMGKPCITTDAPGCKHTVDHGITGLICKVADADALEKAILQFMNLTEDEQKEMGKAAREKALNTFAMQIITQKYLFTVKEL